MWLLSLGKWLYALPSSSLPMLVCKICPQFQGLRQALVFSKDIKKKYLFDWKICKDWDKLPMETLFQGEVCLHLFFMQINKKYLHLQVMFVHSRHMAKLDFVFLLLSCIWVDLDLDFTFPHQEKIHFLRETSV